VDLHSHGGMFMFGKEKVVDLGANHPAMTQYHRANYDGRPTATALVRRGYIVITIDALMFGERRAVLDADIRSGWNRAGLSLEEIQRLNAQCRSKEATLVKALTFAGATWPGIVFWDDIRTVDYLVTRPEVDPARIGCQGISMGGYRAMFLAALDRRIRAGCIVGFMSTVRPMIRRHVDTHSWVHFLPALHRYLDWPDVASLTAPRSLLVLQCAHDGLFPPGGMQETVEKIAAVFERRRQGEVHGPLLRRAAPLYPPDAGRRLRLVRPPSGAKALRWQCGTVGAGPTNRPPQRQPDFGPPRRVCSAHPDILKERNRQ
jgi:hypothetical protein